MTNLYIIENKIESIKRNLKLLRGFKSHSVEALQNEATLNGAVKWYLYLVMQDTIGLAEAVIAFKFSRKPTSYSDCFYILRDEKFISLKQQESLIEMTGFRNRMIHEYDKLDFEKIFEILKNNLNDIEEFLKVISSKLKL